MHTTSWERARKMDAMQRTGQRTEQRTARTALTLALALTAAATGTTGATACTSAARIGTAAGTTATPAFTPRDATADSLRVAASHPGAVTQHVVIVSIDGLRPDAIARYRAATLQRLLREGRFTLDARTILPSRTLPSHTSMLTGVLPAVHGVSWNDDQTTARGVVGVPTVFGVARGRGLRTAAFFSKAKFRHLLVPGTLDYAQAPRGGWGRWFAERTTRDVRTYLAGGARPNLVFVHVGEPDYAGHTVGWMSWLYARAVRRADGAVGEIVAAADAAFGRGGYTLLVTADHGGHRRTHGSADSVDVTIPWIAWGAGVAPGTALGPGIRTMDTAATALWLLGVAVPDTWTGQPVTAAFTRTVETR